MEVFIQRYQQKLALQQQVGLLRQPLEIDIRQGKYIVCGHRKLINFASNDYLGLANSDRLRHMAAGHFKRLGTSASSSRLVSGNLKIINQAEQAYAAFFGYDEALFFPSGYQANIAVLSTLFNASDTILFDKHIHASSIKGLALSKATLYGFNHNCIDHLLKRLHKAAAAPTGVITESLFSMDGDCLPVDELICLKKHHNFMSIVDEAHAFGVLGSQGRGLARQFADVAVGTMGKALGLFGAFVLLPAGLKNYLLNFASPQIYTTTLPPAHAAVALDALELVESAQAQRRHLSDLSRRLKAELQCHGFKISGDAHILAIHMGEAVTAQQTAAKLLDKGFFVLSARFPTVPLHKAVLRISLTAQHDEKDIRQFLSTLKEVFDPDEQ